MTGLGLVEQRSPIADGRATFSVCGRFRYTLERTLAGASRPDAVCLFVMCNPSTADAWKLDPTVKRCVAFARGWGYGRLAVVNAYAYRSPKPRDLYAAAREVELDQRAAVLGADEVNDNAIVIMARAAAFVVCAWGNNGDDRRLGTRGQAVRVLLEDNGVNPYVLGFTDSGSPVHPLARGHHFVPYSRVPQRWA